MIETVGAIEGKIGVVEEHWFFAFFSKNGKML
jgi:hypothetical protein